MFRWMRCPTLCLTLTFAYTLGAAQERVRVTSPDGRNQVTIEIHDGALAYSVDRDGRAVLLPSRLGFGFQGAPPLGNGLRMVDTTRSTVDETWTQPWGEVARVRDQRRADRIHPGRRRPRLVDSIESASPRPLGDAVLVFPGECARQRANT